MTTTDIAVELLDRWQLVVAVVGLVTRAALAWQRELTWPEYHGLHRARRLAFPRLQQVAPVISWINEKGGRTDAEYLATLDRSVKTTVEDCRDGGGSLHLVSSVKRRPPDHGDPLSVAHLVWTHSDDDADGAKEQTEAYLFRNDDGSTDVFAHYEGSVSDPVDHLAGGQQDGDPRGVVREALGLTA